MGEIKNFYGSVQIMAFHTENLVLLKFYISTKFIQFYISNWKSFFVQKFQIWKFAFQENIEWEIFRIKCLQEIKPSKYFFLFDAILISNIEKTFAFSNKIKELGNSAN